MTEYRARPTEFPVSMPDQPFNTGRVKVRERPRSHLWRKLAVFLPSLLLTVWVSLEMYKVLAISSLTLLEWALLVVFVINVSWICFAFVNASVGFAACLHGLWHRRTSADDHDVSGTRTVIVFPVYNESVETVFATVLATANSLKDAPGQYECFILSDTNKPDIALLEEAGYSEIDRRAPSEVPIRYRRRTINAHRKAGNIRDFVTRWGGRYDYMIVYDADSYMESDTIVKLVQAIDQAPRTGLVQTIPQLVGASTLFGRAQQFASALYGPVLGHGIAWWSQKEGNFWGHNAIIRVRALADAAGLPTLPGLPPIGGSILSHDFVEAALLRRAGWNVEIRADLGGSFEEGPPTIIDLVVRDRRWCQGNIQHMAVLLKTRKLAWTSRFHLITGIFSYLASPVWLLFITIGMLLSLQNSFLVPSYFGEGASLFPQWPVIDSERALTLFFVTMGILFAPKVYGLLYGLLNREWRQTVGVLRTFAGVVSELAVSVLMAPILMATQTSAVISVFSGRDAGWSPQARSDGRYTWPSIMRHSLFPTILGIVLTIAAIVISPIYAAWLAPATIGMILSAPITYLTSQPIRREANGKALALSTPADIRTPASFEAAHGERAAFGSLRPQRFAGLIEDQDGQFSRRSIVDPYWPLDRYEVHPPLAMAKARSDRARSISELDAVLSDPEKMALLNAPAELQEIGLRLVAANRVITRQRPKRNGGTPVSRATSTSRRASPDTSR